jgi:Tol biopolymer transport system component
MIRIVTIVILLGLGLHWGRIEVQAQPGYAFGRNKIQYDQFDWHILKTEHFDIYYYSEMKTLAEYGASFAETQYAELKNRFNFVLNERVPMIFYSSNLHFKQTNTTQGFIPDGVGGFFEFLKGRVVIPANGDLFRFNRVIRHELVHVFTFNKLIRVLRDHRKPPDVAPPLWFTEGLAEYWSGEPDYQHEMMIRDGLASNYLAPLTDMMRINGTYLMYKQGEALCRFISEKYGEEKILILIENAWKEVNFDKVMEMTLHEKVETISDQFDAWLKAQYYPLLQNRDAPIRVSKPIMSLGFSAKPVSYQKKDGSRWVFATRNTGSYSHIAAIPVDSTYKPLKKSRIVVEGEKNNRFEALHFFESRMDISRDGKLAFVTKSGERDVLHIFDVEKGKIKATYRFKELTALYSPSFDPTGSKLVFSGIERNGFADLYSYDTVTKTLTKLTNDPYFDHDPAWSPDGSKILFSSDRSGAGQNGLEKGKLGEQSINLYTFDVQKKDIQPLTYGLENDLSPRWSPDGQYVVYISTRPDAKGRWGAQEVWTVEAQPKAENARKAFRLTNFTSVGFDPYWTKDGHILFGVMDSYRFMVRNLGKADSLMAHAKQVETVQVQSPPSPMFVAYENQERSISHQLPYRKKYSLDAVQTVVSTSQLYGANGGGFVVFSDMMGDDYFYGTISNTAQNQRDFLKSMSFTLERYQFKKRTSIGYGLYRIGGLRYDITEPNVSALYPSFYETTWGGYGAVSYPISLFRRLEVSTGLAWSDKNIWLSKVRRKALLLSNSVSFVHDNTLYGYNGPEQGWRSNLTLGYTTDVWRSNVSYYSAIADIRHYWRITPYLTLASRAMGRVNEGREARLFYMGGAWDLRGFGLFAVRGQKMWFTSQELRFPVLENVGLIAPVLAPLGIANLRGALFFDAGRAWNQDYNLRENQLFTGQTLGATGVGLRLNIFGAMVLRYDLGYRFTDNFAKKAYFHKFFFGWDF